MPELPANPLPALLNQAHRLARETLHLALDRKVRLAVTGLSRSGKTVFITALIHQLLNALEGHGLERLEVVQSGRFRGARITPQPNLEVASFRYDRFIDALLGPTPHWPAATEELSEIRLAIRLRPEGLVAHWLSDLTTVELEIIDYPGEWLLDLPLLELSFSEWSARVLESCREEPRRALSAPWRAALERLDPERELDEEGLRRVAELYTDFLQACKTEAVGLSHLQPGRFTLPGALRGTPLLAFCPLPPPAGAVMPGSARGVMEERFESYKEKVVRRFYREHFSRFDRQIVLVDLLKSLNHGPAHFLDMGEALRTAMQSFQYGRSGLLQRLFAPRIDKVLFAATKADHVATNQHHNLERLLNRMVSRPAHDAVFEGVAVKTMALAAVRTTRTVVREHQGRRLSFVQGVPKGRNEEVLLFPGEIPETLPTTEEWEQGRFRFEQFEPRFSTPPAGGVLPHIRLDQAIEWLLGDKLR